VWTGYDGEEKQFKVSEAMAGKEAVWAEIVRENELVETRLHDVADWWLIDVVLYEHGANWKLLDSMNKSKDHGFLGFRDTVKSFNTWIDTIFSVTMHGQVSTVSQESKVSLVCLLVINTFVLRSIFVCIVEYN
jgi:hypothetical protein